MKKKIDLTEGPIWKVLLVFCLPIYVGQIFQNLYNSVDSVVIGQFVGSNELAAVVACSNVSMLMVGFFLGLSTGASVLFSQYYGARDYRQLHDSIHTTVLFTVILGVVITVLGVIFAPQILTFLSCPPEVYEGAIIYLRIYIAGLLFTALYNVGSSILRAIGDSQSPFYYLVIASLTNIVLDVLLVTVVQMGIAGVGIATVISQGLSVILTFGKMAKMDESYRLKGKDLRIDGRLLKQIIALGIPAGVQSCITSVSNIYVQRYINGFGSAAIAGIGSAQKIDQFTGMSAQALGLGITNYIGQNLGAGKDDRVKSGTRIVLLYSLVIIGVTSIPVYLFAPQLMRIFSHDAAVITAGVGMLHLIMPFYEIMGFSNVFSGILRGYGKSTLVMILSIFGMVVCRQVYLAVGLKLAYEIHTIYVGYPLGWFCATLPMVLYYIFAIRRKKIWQIQDQSTQN